MLEDSTVSALVALLVVATVVPAGVPATASATSSESCSSVAYTEFRLNSSVVSSASNSSATVEKENTRVTVKQVPGFVQLHAENPNGYCKQLTVQLAPSVVEPAELGEVGSNDGNATASWRAVEDLETGTMYTEVTFTVEAGSSATFAPSTIRVRSLAWTGEASSATNSVLESVDVPVVGDEGLKKRTYKFSPENNSTTYITVDLVNESTGRQVQEWQAMYRPSPSASWTPVTQEANAPVFYRKPSENQVQFVFNDANATVRFTARPSTLDEAQYQLDSYLSGATELLEKLNINL